MQLRVRWTGWLLAFWMTPGFASAPVDELLQQARELDTDVRQGKALFAEYCVECHGARGEGNAKRRIPVIANQRQAYIVKQFADLREGERYAPPMHGILRQEALQEVQAWVDVAAYVNSLDPPRKGTTGNGKFLALGEAAYREQCSDCHGEDGRGDDDGFVPSLRNQHYSYLLGAMADLADGHRTNVDSELVRFIESLDADERAGLADYLSRLRGKTRDLTWLKSNGIAGD